MLKVTAMTRSTRKIFTGPRVLPGADLTADAFPDRALDVRIVELASGAALAVSDVREETSYVLEGRGYDTIDGSREDWEEGDAVIVPAGTVQRRQSAGATPARLLSFGARTAELSGIAESEALVDDDDEGYEAARPWSALRTAGLADREHVAKRSDTKWENTADGLVRIVTDPDRTDLVPTAVDLYEQEIASMSARHWHLADELVYVVSGQGESRHWRVATAAGDRYAARVAKDASRWPFATGDVVFVPRNTVHQHVNTGREPLRIVVAQSRVFKLLGYDSVVYLDRPRPSAREAIARSSAPSR